MMDLQTIGKVLLAMGIGIAILGLVVWLGGRMGLGALPGDVRAGGESWGCYFPIASMIILSILATIIINVVLRMWNR